MRIPYQFALAISICMLPLGFTPARAEKASTIRKIDHSIIKEDQNRKMQTTIEMLQKRIDALEKKVKKLENGSRLRLIPAARADLNRF